MRALVNNFGPIQHKFFKGYYFSNESLKSIFSLFNLEGKKVLTVGSSGDQAIASAESGSTDITVTDICPMTEYIYDLKVRAKSVLTNEELRSYSSINGFDISLYNKLKVGMKENARKFWDSIYSHKNVDPFYFKNLNIFVEDWRIDDVEKNLHYLDKNELKIMNASLKFIIGDIREFKTDEKYDFIYLSNILEYLCSPSAINQIFDMLKSHLNDNGNIVLKYYWYSKYELNNGEYSLIKKENPGSFEIVEFKNDADRFNHTALVYTKKRNDYYE